MRVLLITLSIIFLSSQAFAKTAEVTFTPPATVDHQVCVVTDDQADISGRYSAGTITQLFGQCTTADGQDTVAIPNIVSGKTWYFVAFFIDGNGDMSDFSNEISVDVPATIPEIVTLPEIEVAGKTISITVNVTDN